jgi:hypothetical protein
MAEQDQEQPLFKPWIGENLLAKILIATLNNLKAISSLKMDALARPRIRRDRNAKVGI